MTELWVPRPYHRRMVDRMVRQSNAGILADPGTGKTSCTLEAFRRLRRDCDVARMLVVAPPRVATTVWPRELAKWEQFADLRMTILHGPKKADRLDDDSDIFVVSIDGVKWLVQQDWDLPEMLVVDELSKFKHPGTRRFRALRRMLPKFARRYGLTGTPSTNGLADLWGQCFVLDRGHALGKTKQNYLEHYFVPILRSGGYYEWVPRRGAEQQILARIAPMMERVSINELDGLPDLATIPVTFELPPKVRASYREFAHELVLGFENGEVTAANAGVRSAKLRQLAGGRVYLDDDLGDATNVRQVETVHKAKQAALAGLLDELGGKRALIVYGFRHDIPAVREALGYEVPVLGGGTTPARAAELVTLWNRGELPHLLIYPCHGLNLQDGGHVLVWYTLPWDLELYQQTVARLYRQGQKDRVLNYQLIAQGTVDRRVAAALAKKDQDQSRLLSSLRHDLQELLR